ncbi:unnamed protein product [Parajaminaea phylloscopi]
MSQPPLRDPFAEPEASSSAGPSLSLGLPRTRRRAPPSTSDNGGASPTPTGLDLRKRSEDDSIRSTDHDALTSRLSSIEAGYLRRDEFSYIFAAGAGGPSNSSSAGVSSSNGPVSGVSNIHPSASQQSLPLRVSNLNPPPILKRPPIINIGTYLRCAGVDALVEAFLTSEPETTKQIVSLGSGSDSRYWRIMSNGQLAECLHHYLELDFPAVVARKIVAIQRSPQLQTHLQPPVTSSSDVPAGRHETGTLPEQAPQHRPHLRSQKYSLHGLDLRLHDQLGDVIASTLDPRKPTLVLAECVLSYIPPRESKRLLDIIASSIHPAVTVAAVSYEMCVAGDQTPGVSTGIGSGPTESPVVSQFGKVMLRNLETRGLSLQGARGYMTPRSHEERFVDSLSASASPEAGSKTSSASRSLSQIWFESLSHAERERLARIEGLDEVEELRLLLGCYALAWACREPIQASRQGSPPGGGGVFGRLDKSIRQLHRQIW